MRMLQLKKGRQQNPCNCRKTFKSKIACPCFLCNFAAEKWFLPVCQRVNEKGIRCKSGTVPAAVSLILIHRSNKSLDFILGRRDRIGTSQKTCQICFVLCLRGHGLDKT